LKDFHFGIFAWLYNVLLDWRKRACRPLVSARVNARAVRRQLGNFLANLPLPN
jgi:hypothetical protein